MKLLIDTNVILDVLINRPQFVKESADILRLSGNGIFRVSASSITDIYYIAKQEIRNKRQVINMIKNLISIIHVVDVSEQEIIYALNSDWKDFEDAVQNAIAKYNDFDVIITRNPADFKKSSISVYTPSEFLEKIKSNSI
ncbi:MAG: PIN domain-containing protein [Treponema sp.]|nr:PIN domain-containing protein [Treponema sp.]